MRKGAFGAGAVGSFATVAGAVLTIASFGMGLPVLIGGIGLNISSAVTENVSRKKGERYKEEKVEIEWDSFFALPRTCVYSFCRPHCDIFRHCNVYWHTAGVLNEPH